MAWNDPNSNKDPWGNGDGPPDLDEALKDLKAKLDSFFGGGQSRSNRGNNNGGGNNASGGFGSMLIIAIVIAAIGWTFMGVNLLDEKEKGVVLRFGKFHEIIGPGFNWNPYLVDGIFREFVTKEEQYPVTGLMLTKDENIVKVPLTVQFNIKSIKDYVLNVSDPLKSLHQSTDSAIRHAVGSTILDDVLGEGRVLLADEVKTRLQRYLDDYGTGIHIVAVTIQEAEPPSAVKDAFDDVIAAKEDKDRYRNEAETYRNGLLPESRGKAQRIIEESNGYKGKVIAQAEGESARFLNLLNEYKKAPKVTRERLYIDALEAVYSNSSKVMVDIEGGNNMMYLPLDKLVDSNNATSNPNNTLLREQVVKDVIEQLNRQFKNNNQGLR